MRKVLVTGGAGFMGSDLAKYLTYVNNDDVLAVDDLSGGYESNLIACPVTLLRGDCNDPKVKEVIRQWRPEIVFHLAADATEGRSQFTPVNCTERNTNAMLNTLVAALAGGYLEKFVFTSSMSVYGAQKPPFREDMERIPEDVYAVAKSGCERNLEILAKVHGFRYTIIRPHNVYGPGQNLADPYRNVVGIWINNILRGKPLYIYGDGEQRRAFSYISDVTPYLAAVGSANTVSDSEIFNIGSDEHVTLNKLAKVLLKVTGAATEIKHVPWRPQEVKYAYSDHEKAERLLGFHNKTSLEQGVRNMWEWAKRLGPQEPKWFDEMEINSDKLPATWKERLY